MSDNKILFNEIHEIKFIFIDAMSVFALFIIDDNFIETFNDL